ncbi:MAG: hypothetical protein EOM51_09320 [Clostridia bacterium]|nr:hypothetical protein [Clostridia bacterium]
MKITNKIPIEHPAFQLKLGSGFLLLIALIFFFDEDGFLSALLPAVLMHEMGHVLAMLFFGARPIRLSATLSGLEIDYSGAINEKQELATALAGPAAGIIFSLLCAGLGRCWESEYLMMCSGLSMVLNIFNLLPALPLDGGRALGFMLRFLLEEKAANSLLRGIGLITALTLTAFGLYFTARGFGIALFAAGIWLFIAQTNRACK